MGFLNHKSFPIGLTLAAILLIVGGAGLALGGGGAGVGNGGDVVPLPDGTWRLADPYVTPAAPGGSVSFSTFNPNIIHEVEVVGQLLVRLGAAASDLLPPLPPGAPPLTINQKNAAMAKLKLQGEVSRTGQALFVKEFMEDSNISYYFVDKLPTGCWTPGDVQLPPVPGASPTPTPSPMPTPTVVQAGCTQGSSTFFIKSIFDNMALRNGKDPSDPREQVKFLIHERIHAIDISGEEPSYIADVTNGIDVLLDLHFAEQAGQRPVLTSDQIQALQTLIERVGYTYDGMTQDPALKTEEFQDGGEWHISPNGGGLYSSYAQIAPDAYLGIGSLLSDGGVLGSGATMIDSACYLTSCVLANGASLINSMIAPNISSRQNSPQEPPMGESFDDELFAAQIGNGASVSNASFEMDIPTGTPDTETPTEITIGDGATVQQNVAISGVTGLSIGNGANVTNDSLVFNVTDAASTTVTIGDQGSLSSLAALHIATSLTNGATARALTFPGATAFAFPNGSPLCAAPLSPMLSLAVTIGSVAAFSSLCVSPLPVPQFQN